MGERMDPAEADRITAAEETAAILADPGMVAAIAEGREAAARGDVLSADEVDELIATRRAATAARPWTVTLCWTWDQNGGAVSVHPSRSPVHAVLGRLSAGETPGAVARDFGVTVEAVEVLARLADDLTPPPADDAAVAGALAQLRHLTACHCAPDALAAADHAVEDARLLVVAEARVASDTGRRHDLDEVIARIKAWAAAGDATEQVARFLRLNYRAAPMPGRWEDAEPDEREAWLCEASHIVRLVRAAGAAVPDPEEDPRG